MEKPIYIVPMGLDHTPDIELEFVSSCLSKSGFKPEILPKSKIDIPTLPKTQQTVGPWDPMNADIILGTLIYGRLLSGNNNYMLGVVGGEIRPEKQSFAYGYAHLKERVAVVSFYRPKLKCYGIWRDLVNKTINHELLHMIGIPHCESNKPENCLMSALYGDDINELKKVASDICKDCHKKYMTV